jgi:hypothetical protein
VNLSKDGVSVLDSIFETMDLWNLKLKNKGRPNIQLPIVVGLADKPVNCELLNQNIHSILNKPILKEDVVRTVNDIRY